MDLDRIITIYIAQMTLCLWDAYLAYRILKRDKKRLNFIFAGFYIFGVIVNIFNFIYAPLFELPGYEAAIMVLNFFTNFFLFYSPIFFVVFELMLLKSEKYINTTKQLLILIGYGIFMFCMIFFAHPDWGLTFNPKGQPDWELPLFLYLIIGESLFAVGPVFYLSYRAYNKFEDAQLKKKWKNFIYGFGAYMIFLYTIFISNTLNDPNFRRVTGYIGFICAFVGGYLMYIGVTRQLEK